VFTSRDYLTAGVQFLLYALGMSVVVVGLTRAIAVFRGSVRTKARPAMRYVESAGAPLLLIAGAYIMYYWLTLGGLMSAIGLMATIRL
jgi:hypothetical protein